MNLQPPVNIAITGGAGHIGYALLFRIASGAMFGPNTPVNLRLLEIEPALGALQGVAMELEDCASPLLKSVTCTADANIAFRDVNWACLVGSAPRKAGMERSDLLKINGGIFSAQGKTLNDNAADDVRVVVVGNPCNTNAMVAMHNAPDIPKDQFFAMTMLDEHRARAQLALKTGADITDVKRLVIWGNHSATQYPDFYNASINGVSTLEAVKDETWLQDEFIPVVQKRGAAIIEARGASSAASAANALIDTVTALTTPTAEDDYFSVCKCSNGEYGIDENLIFSYPCQLKNGELHVVEGLEHNAFGQAKIDATLQELRAERDAVKEMGLID